MKSHASAPKGQYPCYDDGDVWVIVTPTDRLKLHRHILRISSTKLYNLLDSRGERLNKRALERNVNTRWRLHYVREEECCFKSIPLTPDGEPQVNVGVTNFNGRVVPAEVRALLMLLKAFYHIDLAIDRTNMGTILTDVQNLLDVAERLGSVATVRYTVENALLAEGQNLWEAVAHSPHYWVGMACRLQSRIIYKDCFIHLVGRYSVFRRMLANKDMELCTAIDMLPSEVKRKVEAKYNKAFVERCRYVESTIVQYYPPALYRTAETGRKDYANDVFMHMALNLFRHWFGMQVVQGRNHTSSEDSGWAFYEELLAGGQAYLSRDDVKEWHEKFPMSVKGSSVLHNHLNEIKEAVRELVKDLYTNESQLPDDSTKRRWLTFTKVRPDDYPWDATTDANAFDDDSDATEMIADDDEDVVKGEE